MFGHPAPGLARSWMVLQRRFREVILREGRKHFVPKFAKIAPGGQAGFLHVLKIRGHRVPDLAQDRGAFGALKIL